MEWVRQVRNALGLKNLPETDPHLEKALGNLSEVKNSQREVEVGPKSLARMHGAGHQMDSAVRPVKKERMP
jgi:hypothetical protein